MDSYVLSHYRRRFEKWLKENFKALKELNNVMSGIAKLATAAFVIVYGITIVIKAIVLANAGTSIVYFALIKASFVVALKFMIPLVLIVGGIIAIHEMLN